MANKYGDKIPSTSEEIYLRIPESERPRMELPIPNQKNVFSQKIDKKKSGSDLPESKESSKMGPDSKAKFNAQMTGEIGSMKAYRDAETFHFMKKIKQLFKNGFKEFAQYLIPICFMGLTCYMMYMALTNDWLIMYLKPDGIFASILGDTSTKSNSDHVQEIKKTKKATCPLLDLIVFIKNLVLKAIFAVLKALFPSFYFLMSRFK